MGYGIMVYLQNGNFNRENDETMDLGVHYFQTDPKWSFNPKGGSGFGHGLFRGLGNGIRVSKEYIYIYIYILYNYIYVQYICELRSSM